MSDEVELAEERLSPLKGTSLGSDAWKRLKRNKMAMFGLVVVVFYALVALAAPILPIYGYEEQVIEHIHLPPSWNTPAGQLWLEKETDYLNRLAAAENRSLSGAETAKLASIRAVIGTDPKHQRHYLFGTDYLGRDMLSRVIYGGQISMAIGLVGALTSVFLGILLGALAGYLGGRVDQVIMRIVDILYGLPYMLLVIIFMAVFGKNILNLFFALAVVSWLTEAMVVRGQVISLKNSEFIEAARSIGAGTPRIIFRHLLPNTLGIIIVFSTLRIPSFIMSEAFLSFLGLGISAPLASWGSLVGDAVEGMTLFPWRLIFPAVVMTLFLFSMNFLGDGLRDAFDPQSKNR